MTDLTWQTMESAPIDGTPFEAIYWFRNYDATDPRRGYWSPIRPYAFATAPLDEQCWHSIPRQSCIRKTDHLKRWRWRPSILPDDIPDGD